MSMEEIYWNRFFETGKVADYLYYKGMEICKNVMDGHESMNGHEREDTCESDYGDGHGTCRYIYRGI